MPLGFSKACRTCLTLDGTLISIYDTVSYDGKGCVTDMIKDFTKIKPIKSDGLPELVCQTCFNEINRCYSFKVKCLNSDCTLRKLFATEEELVGQQQVVVQDEEKECKPIISNLTLLQVPVEVQLDQEPPPIKIKTEKDLDADPFGYFVISSVCGQSDQVNEAESDNTNNGTFHTPQIKEEVDYEMDSYNTSSTRRLTNSDVCPSAQSLYLDNFPLELTYPHIKLEAEESIESEPQKVDSIIESDIRCPTCGKEFLYTSRLKKHMRSHAAKPFFCSICTKKFKLSGQLRRHIDVSHRNIKPFTCEVCSRSFSFPSKLKEHLKSHKGILQPFKCEECPKTFAFPSKLEEHIRTHKTYNCEECPRTFVYPSKLKEHLRSHRKVITNMETNFDVSMEKKENDEKPILGFKPSTECLEDSHCEQKKEPKYDANITGSGNNLDENNEDKTDVSMNDQLRSTRRSARNRKEEINNPDGDTAEFSSTKVKTRQSEKSTRIDYSYESDDQHPDEKNSPEGSRQFHCPHCSKVFKYLSRFNDHIVCHSDARPFDCINCGKFFKTPGQLTRHLKTSHKISSFRSRRKAFSRRRAFKRNNFNKLLARNKADPNKTKIDYTDKDNRTNEMGDDLQSEHMIEKENTDGQSNEMSDNLPENVKTNEINRKVEGVQLKTELVQQSVLPTTKETGGQTNNEPRIYECQKCDETFTVLSRFYGHMKGHGVERPFICKHCGKGFKKYWNLNSHIMISHKKIKPFKCNDCHRAFSCKSNLNKHMSSRIWTNSCTEDFAGRRGTKKKIKKKIVPQDLNIEHDNFDENKQTLEDNFEEINENPNNPHENVQEQNLVGENKNDNNTDETNFVEISPDVTPDITEPEPEPSRHPLFDSMSEQTTSIPKSSPKNKLECPQCKKVFVYVSYLKKHLQSHSTERPYGCLKCDKTFKYKVSLNSHNMITHAKVKPYKCDQCPEAFVNEYNYRVHRNSHNKLNHTKAKYKPRRVVSKPQYDELLNIANVDKSVSNLQENTTEEVAVGMNNEQTTCSLCYVSIQSEKLAEHMQQYHNSTESTSTLVNSVNHQKDISSIDSENRHECPECNKVFLFASYLKKHMRSHNHERPFICSTCGKTFKDHWRLRTHIREKHTHKKKRKYNYRGKPASTVMDNKDEKDHNAKVVEESETTNKPQDWINNQHNSTESKISETNSSKLEIAKQSKQIENRIVELVKPRCTICNREFTFASQLEAHMRTHTGERPFSCPNCEKTFTQKGHLKNHILINHKNIMPFQCRFCLRGFASGFNMRVHEKTHTKENRKLAKPNRTNNDNLMQTQNEDTTAGTTRETMENPLGNIQDQIIQDFAKLELHPLFGTMSNQDENTTNEPDNCYRCPRLHCNKTYRLLSQLNEHMQSHKTDNMLLPQLNERIQTNTITNINTNTDKPFTCKICNKTFKKEPHLKGHIQMSHTKTRNYKCNECDRDFLTFYILNKHMRSHKGKKKRSKGKTKSKRGLKIGINNLKQTHHSEQLCSTSVDDHTTKDQTTHRAAETPNNSVRITCALCSVSVDSDNLTDHMKACLKPSQSTIELNLDLGPQHLGHPLFETLSNQDEQPTETVKQCFECKKEFCSISKLAEHMRTHSGERPFICTACGRGFKKSAHLKSHIMIVHKKILPYKCLECSRVFSSKYNLTVHSKTHTARANRQIRSYKKRAVVKKSYYKDPPYHAKPIHTENPDKTTTDTQKKENENENNKNDDIFANSLEQYKESQYAVDRIEEYIRCTLCFVSVQPDNLSKHMQEVHNTPESLTFVAIKKEPCEETELLEHSPLEIELNQTPTAKFDSPPGLQCPTCDKEFVHLSRLNEHMRTHSDERPYICLVCGKTFKRHGHLTTHIATNHKKEKPFKCKECPLTFSSSLNLNVHLQEHISEELPVRLPVETSLLNEDNLQPAQNDGPLCYNMDIQQTECSTTDEAHQCTLCPTVFKTISHLMEHMKVHTSDQPFICSLCGKGFSSNDDLSTHLLIRHNYSKSFKCDQCARKFITISGLKKHLVIHTGYRQQMLKAIRREKLNKKPDNQELLSYSEYVPQCHICKKEFTNNWVLKEHMKIHTNERPFICPICGHAFSKKYNLKIHIMAHKKIKPFKCENCSLSFITNAGRNHHMRTQHKKTELDLSNSENLIL